MDGNVFLMSPNYTMYRTGHDKWSCPGKPDTSRRDKGQLSYGSLRRNSERGVTICFELATRPPKANGTQMDETHWCHAE